VRLRNVPSSISFKTDGCTGSVTFDKKDLMYVSSHGTDCFDSDDGTGGNPARSRKRKMPDRNMPAAAKKRQKGHNGRAKTVNEISNNADLSELEKLRTGLIHLKNIKSRKDHKNLKARFEKACRRVLGVDPGAIDAMTVARDDDPENSFRVPTSWLYVLIMASSYSIL
jgi:hypothetical protein